MKDYSNDFEGWAHDCVRITDKLSGQLIAFDLNKPQRRVLSELESMRRSGQPIRLIMLKARQWGGSTLIQTYMAWMQLVVRTGWNSLICAHVKDASAGIKGMYSRLLREYPEELKSGSPRDWEFVPYEKSQSVSYIGARDAQVAVATAQSPNSLRGSNFMMAHLSEVAFWGDGDARAASEIVRTVSGSIPLQADTLVVMESTANGTDNYFYSEWKRAVRGESDKLPIFVPWYEIEIYRYHIRDAEEERNLKEQFDDYEHKLLELGLDVEQVAWYHCKRREYTTHESMMAEFPSTADEAFTSVSTPFFMPEEIPQIAQTDFSLQKGRRVVVMNVAAGQGDSYMSLFSEDGGQVVALSDWNIGRRVADAMRDVAKLCRREGAELMIVELPDSDLPSHGRWCARKAEQMGLSLYYDEDESAVTTLDSVTLSEATDRHREQLSEGAFVETQPEAVEEYRRFCFSNPERYPRIIARMAFTCRQY
jgi:hypothetical protein